jgi:hypothetical protein
MKGSSRGGFMENRWTGMRMGQHAPYLRMVAILGTVAALNFIGAWLMARLRIRERYHSR